MPAHTSCLTGSLGEMAFERHFFGAGCLIAAPRFDLFKVDFVLEWQNRLVKVQVKTMSHDKRANNYTVNIGTKRNGVRDQPYSADEVDYFGIINLDYDCIWLIPISATIGKRTLKWIDPQKRCWKKKAAFDWDQYLIN